MASAFKQQCPSCEAMVPIRDPALIGRKIDCPTCKYRFVVEEPADAVDEEEPAAKGKAGAPAAKGKPGGKPAPAKTKPGRRRDEDEEEDERPRSKSEGGSTKLIVGLLVGVVGVALIGVAVYFGFIHDSDSSKPKPAPIASNPTKPTPATNPGGEATQGTGETEKTEGVRGRGGILGPGGVTDPTQGQPGQPAAPNPADLYSELTNLLPIDTEGVIHVPFKALQGTPLGRMIFDSPGGFAPKEFENRVGISLNDVDRFVQAISFRNNWTFQVVKTTQPIDFGAVTKALQLKAAPGGASDYFLAQSSDWADLLFRYKSASGPMPLRTLAVKLHDKNTLVFGDEEPIRGFLTASGRFPPVHKGAFLPFAAGSPPPGGTATPEVAPARGTPFVEPGRQGTPGGTPEAAGPPQRPYYITIPAELKGMLDRLEDRPTLVSMAFDTRASKGQLSRFIPTFVNLMLAAGLTPQQFEQGRVLGLAAHPLRNGLNLHAQLDCADIASSRVLRKTLQEHGAKLTKVLEATLGVKATVANDQPEAADPGPGGESEGGRTNVLNPRIGIGGRGTGEGGLAIITPPGGRRPGGNPEEPTAAESTSTIETARQERTVAIRVNLVFDNDAFRKVETLVKQHVQAVRVDQEMAAGQPRWHEVGAATLAERDKKANTYPRGTYHREPDGNRAGVPYPPSQRVSWMASLLPHLGHDVSIDHGKSWQDKENLATASMLVPQFLDPRSPRSTWFVRHPGMSQDVGATHLVGMAGIGVEAAEYKMNDPNVKSKLGMFGYDRATKASDITDGAQYTIMMIQVPPTFKRPWMAGGGATVMGVPDPNPPRPSQKSISPFVSTEHGGRKGTMAIMADGSVRFIPADTSDEVFKAMCTIQGGDQTFRDDQAPLVKGTESAATIRTAPTQTPKVEAPVTSAAWKEFVSKEGGFSVLAPTAPVTAKLEQQTPQGRVPVLQHHITMAGGRAMISVSAFPNPAELKNADLEKVLLSVQAGVLATFGGKVKGEKKTTFVGQPGREIDVDHPMHGQCRFIFMLTNGKLYALVFVGADRIGQDNVQKLLDSFTLLRQ